MLLLLGFRPFAGRGVNGSETLICALQGQEINGHPVTAVALDVVWGSAEQRLSELVKQWAPDLVLGFGEGREQRVSVERVAVNLAVGRDEAGVLREGEPLDPAGEDRRHCTLPFEHEWCRDLGLQVRESNDAGAFLCNSLLYHGLKPGRPPCGFVHLPVQGGDSDAAYLERVQPISERLLSKWL